MGFPGLDPNLHLALCLMLRFFLIKKTDVFFQEGFPNWGPNVSRLALVEGGLQAD